MKSLVVLALAFVVVWYGGVGVRVHRWQARTACRYVRAVESQRALLAGHPTPSATCDGR